MRTGHVDLDFDAVVIGASAGGFDAMQRILEALQPDFAPAMLVVLHLPPGRPSNVATLLARCCFRPVDEALDKQPIQSGSVLFAPPDYHLLVEPQRTIALSRETPVLFSRPAIDPLFESAALAYGERLLAILLTGASVDGSDGLATVREQGGQAWVQDPADARVPLMPEAALRRAGADAVLTLSQICRRLGGTENP